MKKLTPSEKVYANKSLIIKSERGVFARLDIKKDELIERCPIIEVSKNDLSKLNESFLVTYFFYFGKNKEKLAVSLGYGSLYNHSYKPNAIYKISPKEQTMDFIAIKDIKKDEEISFNYKLGNPSIKTPLWFEVK